MPKINNLPNATTLDLSDKVLGVVGGLAKNMTLTQLKSLIGTTVEDSLASDSATSALSAAQGKALMDSKLDSSEYNNYYKGTYTTLGNLQSAHATSTAGSYALIDGGSGQDAVIYVWDAQDGWVQGGASGSLANTDALAEGSANLYFTSARAISAVTSTINEVLNPTINTQTGASYTLQSADNDGKTILRMTSASANTVEIPSTLTLPISIRQAGTGTTTLQEGSGVMLNGTLAFSAQHQTKTIYRVSSGIYDVVG